MSANTNKGLGRGFGSLLPQDFDQSMLLDKHDRIQKVSLTEIKPDPDQPRKNFDQESLNELASSIKRYGILQPLVVVKREDSYYIVAGERRFRAAQIAELKTVPVLARTLKEIERLEISLVENVQRVDLNPVEQAVSIAKLHEQFNVDYKEVAQRLGKAHSTIVNIVRLLQLPDFARDALAKGKISEGHARSVLALKDEKLQKELVNSILKEGWSVRRAEQFVGENREARPTLSPAVKPQPSKASEQLNKVIGQKWGVKAAVVPRLRGGGKITLDFKTSQQLDKFIDYLSK